MEKKPMTFGIDLKILCKQTFKYKFNKKQDLIPEFTANYFQSILLILLLLH